MNKFTEEDVFEVFEYYKKVFKKRSDYILSPGRQKKIEGRLKTFSKEELKQAIDNISQSSYHNGKNENGKQYNDILFVFRNYEKTFEWINYWEKPECEAERDLGDAILESYKIYSERYLGTTPTFCKEEMSIFYSLAKTLIEKKLTASHVPQALCLAYFAIKPQEPKSPWLFMKSIDWIIPSSPIKRESAAQFVETLYYYSSKKKVRVSQKEAEELLAAEGVIYEGR